MKSKIGAIIAIGIVGWTVWYFLIKEEHYTISFAADQPVGLVQEHLVRWPRYQSKNIDSVSLENKSPGHVNQKVFVGDSLHLYNWKLSSESFGKTKVTVSVTDPEYSFKQKWLSLFGKTDLSNRSMQNVQNVHKALEIESEKFRVHSIKDTTVQGQFCVYLPVATKSTSKARSMLQHIAPIMDYINTNDLELQGDPFLEVTSWDAKNDSLSFDFCFPLQPSDSLPKTSLLQFKTSNSFSALKAEYNGNYNSSGRSWHYLLEYARYHDLKVDSLATEFYLNDPHEGGDPLLWKALIFLPLLEE